MSKVYLGLGSNIEPRLDFLQEAVEKLADSERIMIVKKSSVYQTKPYGYLEQEDFLNAVILIKTSLNPEELLEKVLKIEKEIGRVRDEVWGPRKIDIDILLYDKIKYASKNLEIPHPEIKKRAFVMIPLLEIADTESLQLEGKEVKSWLEELDYSEEDVKLFKKEF